ncbi:hypothetical protein [uncultured phage cr85_1]|uniref:Tail fiber protein n=1 Tax=uncultured phage cr85_1 TaxID=2772074 RepID=A0A7M1RYG8_9CAUD|nr:hypothetical protein KNV41_gp082 [uncultured phage cr85_1]QOR59457.1 hypothetical protein [uncultured phage cr85_1]
MKIINSIMPMSDIEALAANGQKLRVAVTKTSAQGKAAQSATPNLMSFSTDENSVWFNGKMYGVHKFNNVSSLNTNSTAEQVLSALNVSKSSELYDLAHKGVLFIDTVSGNTMVKYEDGGDTFQLYIPSSDSRSIERLTITVSSNKVTGLTTISHLTVDDIRNTLTSTETNKALSAAQGKALNDRISGLGNVYRVKGTKTNLSDVLALTNAGVGDVWNVTNAFTLGGKPYPANTNVVCITATSSSDHDEGNWDPLGGTVNLSAYVPKSDIVDNLSTSDSKKPLSAKQGLALATMITELEDNKETYQLLKTFESGTLSTQSEIDAILGPYSSFNAALNAGKVIHGVYKDSINRMNTVAFSAFNDTTNSRVRMFAILNNSTLLYMQATYSGTNWTSATTNEESFSASITIE